MTQNLYALQYMKYGESRNPDGRPSSWNHGKTKTIRVPIVLADEIEHYARTLDGKDIQDVIQNLDGEDLQNAIAILREALTFPANTGGKIKQNIRTALQILERS